MNDDPVPQWLATMHADLAPEQVEFLQTVIASGAFRNEGEALTEAVKLLQRREDLRSKLMQGEKELDAGLGVPAEQVFARLKQRAAELDRAADGPLE